MTDKVTRLEDIPGIRAAMKNGNITYMHLEKSETSPVTTDGFSDEQILEMDPAALNKQLAGIEKEEQMLVQSMTSLNKRRQQIHRLIARKAEIS